MAEKVYVEKRAALNAICKACDRQHPDDKENCPQKFAGCMEFYNVFELPAADVEPVRHGHWIRPFPTTTKSYKYICSLCGMTNYFIGNAVGKSCSHCTAKMDGGEKA